MSYLQVSSNDTLSHQALPGSPETLCGKIVVGTPPPPYSRDISEQNYLICDLCATLSGGNSILKETAVVEAGRDCPHCHDGIDDTGLACWNCGGSGWLDEGDDSEDPYAVDLTALDDDEPLRATRVGSTSVAESPRKLATNWTRDGEPIENGFEVVISTEQAARTPFLDLTRVSVSERRECPDCHEDHWLSKIASCTECDGLKCSDCMETIGIDSFLGMCKKCAQVDPNLSYEAVSDDSYADADRYLSYLMTEEESEPDDFFLPSDFE